MDFPTKVCFEEQHWYMIAIAIAKERMREGGVVEAHAGDNNVVVVRGGLAAVGDDGEQRQYRGMVDGVGGEAQTEKINGPSCAVAKIDGIKVGKGGGGYCNNGGREWNQS